MSFIVVNSNTAAQFVSVQNMAQPTGSLWHIVYKGDMAFTPLHYEAIKIYVYTYKEKWHGTYVNRTFTGTSTEWIQHIRKNSISCTIVSVKEASQWMSFDSLSYTNYDGPSDYYSNYSSRNQKKLSSLPLGINSNKQYKQAISARNKYANKMYRK